MSKNVIYVEGEPTDEEIDQLIDRLYPGSEPEESEEPEAPEQPSEEE